MRNFTRTSGKGADFVSRLQCAAWDVARIENEHRICQLTTIQLSYFVAGDEGSWWRKGACNFSSRGQDFCPFVITCLHDKQQLNCFVPFIKVATIFYIYAICCKFELCVHTKSEGSILIQLLTEHCTNHLNKLEAFVWNLVSTTVNALVLGSLLRCIVAILLFVMDIMRHLCSLDHIVLVLWFR